MRRGVHYTTPPLHNISYLPHYTPSPPSPLHTLPTLPTNTLPTTYPPTTHPPLLTNTLPPHPHYTLAPHTTHLSPLSLHSWSKKWSIYERHTHYWRPARPRENNWRQPWGGNWRQNWGRQGKPTSNRKVKRKCQLVCHTVCIQHVLSIVNPHNPAIHSEPTHWVKILCMDIFVLRCQSVLTQLSYKQAKFHCWTFDVWEMV